MRTNHCLTLLALTIIALFTIGMTARAQSWIAPLPGGPIYVSPTSTPVGIGTTTPTSSLSVVGNSDISNDLIIGHDLSVANNISCGHDVTIGNNAAVSANATVGTLLTVGNDANVSHDVNVTNDMTVSNDISAGHNATVTNKVYWGGNNADLTDDQGGSLELGADNFTPGCCTPYIDFHYSGLTQNYNVRLQNTANGELSIFANQLYTWANVGIGATTPLARLHVDNGALLVTGTTGPTPVSGAGTRMMWVPAKKAFRAGSVTGSQWDDPSIGTNSFAGGLDNRAIGAQSASFGSNNTSSGLASFSANDNNVASGDFSAAFGDHTTAQAYKEVTLGRYNVVAGTSGSWVASEPLLVAGNGTAASASNAMTLYKNGNMNVAGNYTTSDARLKKDIVPMTSVLPKLQSIQPVYFYYNDLQVRPAEHQLGFLAQEVQKEFPEAVITTENGYLAVGYDKMAAVAIEAIKEQQQTILQLQSDKATLASRAAGLTTRIQARQALLDQRAARLAQIQALVHQMTGCCPETDAGK